MAISNIRNRIMKAQMKAQANNDLGRLAALLARGAFYDECTDEEKNAYCKYQGTEREALENINGYILGTLHFKLERRQRRPTEAEQQRNFLETRMLVQEMVRMYNTPEARAKREEGYQEMQRIGKLRKAAYDRGESWDAYPLPWGKEGGGSIEVDHSKIERTQRKA